MRGVRGAAAPRLKKLFFFGCVRNTPEGNTLATQWYREGLTDEWGWNQARQDISMWGQQPGKVSACSAKNGLL